MTDPTTRFPHRHHDDGTHDSICMNCFATIATKKDEAELAEEERNHICKAAALYGRSPSVRSD